MSIIRVDIEPEVLSDAVLKSDRGIEEVQKRFNNFDKWIKEEVNPTFNQLNELSKYLRIPFGYLLLETPVEEDPPLVEFLFILY